MYILSVYGVGPKPQQNETLYLCEDLLVINGQFDLDRRPDGTVHAPHGIKTTVEVFLRGHIKVRERLGSDTIDYEDVLHRFRQGERCSIETCPTCGHNPDGLDLLNLLREEAANHPDRHVQAALRRVEQTLLDFLAKGSQ